MGKNCPTHKLVRSHQVTLPFLCHHTNGAITFLTDCKTKMVPKRAPHCVSFQICSLKLTTPSPPQDDPQDSSLLPFDLTQSNKVPNDRANRSLSSLPYSQHQMHPLIIENAEGMELLPCLTEQSPRSLVNNTPHCPVRWVCQHLLTRDAIQNNP